MKKIKLDDFNPNWTPNLPGIPRFDGGVTQTWADQYVERCSMGAVNLHIYQMGHYQGCGGCKLEKDCKSYASVAGEQAEI